MYTGLHTCYKHDMKDTRIRYSCLRSILNRWRLGTAFASTSRSQPLSARHRRVNFLLSHPLPSGDWDFALAFLALIFFLDISTRVEHLVFRTVGMGFDSTIKLESRDAFFSRRRCSLATLQTAKIFVFFIRGTFRDTAEPPCDTKLRPESL